MHLSILQAVIVAMISIPLASAQLNDLAKEAGKKYFGTATDNDELSNTTYFKILTDTREFGQLTPANGQKVYFLLISFMPFPLGPLWRQNIPEISDYYRYKADRYNSGSMLSLSREFSTIRPAPLSSISPRNMARFAAAIIWSGIHSLQNGSPAPTGRRRRSLKLWWTTLLTR